MFRWKLCFSHANVLLKVFRYQLKVIRPQRRSNEQRLVHLICPALSRQLCATVVNRYRDCVAGAEPPHSHALSTEICIYQPQFRVTEVIWAPPCRFGLPAMCFSHPSPNDQVFDTILQAYHSFLWVNGIWIWYISQFHGIIIFLHWYHGQIMLSSG